MLIRKYDRGFSRRHFNRLLAGGVFGGGVLCSLWPALADDGDISRAYPDELLDLGTLTGGKVEAGDTVTADNVEHVRNLLTPVQYRQVAELGRRLEVGTTTTDWMQLSPWEYNEATLRHRGRARFDGDGNVVADDGGPWLGGNPFPEPRTAVEAFAGLTLSWGRHDAAVDPVREVDLDREGNEVYHYQSCSVELSPVGRCVLEPRPHWPGHEHRLRYHTVFFTTPADVRGTAYLNIWPYDQRRFPELHGYLPAFKRIRRYPTNQRFEPLIPGATLYLSDTWAAGDPFLTWGDYRVVGRGPMLAAVAENWVGRDPDWRRGTHGGPRGSTFFDTRVELVPEALVVEARPVKYPRAPVGKKRVWFDVRTMLPIAMVSYDRKDQPFRTFDGAYSVYRAGDREVRDGEHPYWSWTHVHAHDVQTGRMSRLEHVRQIAGGHTASVNDPSVYQRYLTRSALGRLGV